jgi:glycosyltransferase involved in cell wall biosynthesis
LKSVNLLTPISCLSTMKISIVVPNFNYAEFLPRCLDSIACQSYQNIEVLLADAGSTDGSVKILEYYAEYYGWSFFSRSDNGQADVINRGLMQASGDIHCWLNSDDFYLSNRALEKVVGIFEEYAGLELVSLGGYYVNASGYWLRPVMLNTHPLLRQTDLAFRGAFLQPATFWKAHLFEELGGLNANYRYVFDQHFLIRAGRKYSMLLDQDIRISGYCLHGLNLSIGVKSERISEIADSNRYFFGFGFRFIYLKVIAFIVLLVNLLPSFLSRRITFGIYAVNNLLSFLSLYRIPSI